MFETLRKFLIWGGWLGRRSRWQNEKDERRLVVRLNARPGKYDLLASYSEDARVMCEIEVSRAQTLWGVSLALATGWFVLLLSTIDWAVEMRDSASAIYDGIGFFRILACFVLAAVSVSLLYVAVFSLDPSRPVPAVWKGILAFQARRIAWRKKMNRLLTRLSTKFASDQMPADVVRAQVEKIEQTVMRRFKREDAAARLAMWLVAGEHMQDCNARRIKCIKHSSVCILLWMVARYAFQ